MAKKEHPKTNLALISRCKQDLSILKCIVLQFVLFLPG